MSSQKEVKVSDAEGADAVVQADELVQQLRALHGRLPQVVQVVATPNQKSQLGHVDERFVTAAINAIGATPDVQPLLGSTDAELRAMTEESKLWTAAIDEARVLLANLTSANERRRQKYGLVALQTYSICRQLVRDGGDQAARLGPHVVEMRRLNRFGKPRRSQPSGDPQQPQTPAPAPKPA